MRAPDSSPKKSREDGTEYSEGLDAECLTRSSQKRLGAAEDDRLTLPGCVFIGGSTNDLLRELCGFSWRALRSRAFTADDGEKIKPQPVHSRHPSAPEQSSDTREYRNRGSLPQADRKAQPDPIPPNSGDPTVATIGTRSPIGPVVPDTADVPEITAPTLGWSHGNRTLGKRCDSSSFSS